MDARVLLPRRLNGEIESTCPRQYSPLERRTTEANGREERRREKKELEAELLWLQTKRNERKHVQTVSVSPRLPSELDSYVSIDLDIFRSRDLFFSFHSTSTLSIFRFEPGNFASLLSRYPFSSTYDSSSTYRRSNQPPPRLKWHCYRLPSRLYGRESFVSRSRRIATRSVLSNCSNLRNR